MRVSGTGSSGRVAVTRNSARAAGSGSTFKLESNAPARAGGVAGGHRLAAVDALVALQEVPDATARRSKAMRRGEDMLDLLDDIKIGILSGGMSRSRIIKLARLVEDRRDEVSDTGLKDVLDEIELRARVELAKLEHAA